MCFGEKSAGATVDDATEVVHGISAQDDVDLRRGRANIHEQGVDWCVPLEL